MPTITIDVERPNNPGHSGTYELSGHAWKRQRGRSIPKDAVSKCLQYGRVMYIRKCRLFVIGKKEIKKYRRFVDLRGLNGIHVVTPPEENVVKTVYKNEDLHLKTLFYN